jgi:nucleoside-diphosphate-sugar epimerase
MNILITSGTSELSKTLADHLAARHEIRLTDRLPAKSDHDFAVSPLGHDGSTRLLLQDRDALILVQRPLDADTEHVTIDIATRGVYNLLTAAVEAGVWRVLCISTLDLMKAYEPALAVSERWRPRPTTSPDLLGAYLTEAVCREFAREHKLEVLVLRIGDLTDDIDATSADEPSSGLHWEDFVDAVEKALAAEPKLPWTVLHIQSDVPNARYTTDKARQEINFLSQTAYES